MSKSIKKFEPLPPELQKQQEEAGESFRVGDMFFEPSNRGRILRIKEVNKNGWEWVDAKSREDKRKIKVWQVILETAKDWEATKWSSWGDKKFDSFLQGIKEGTYVRITRPLSEVMDEANKVIKGEISIDVYSQNEFENSMNEETALIGRNSKAGLVAIERSLDEKRRTADLIQCAVGYEMEKRKQELNAIKDNLYKVVAKFERQITRIRRVITTIELYLGIDEEIHQIQEGEKAPANTPISFRQLVLFIDEEVGAHENGGLDFKSIEQFDEWLLKDKNIDIVLPEKKGIVVLRPRRHNKEYVKDDFLNVIMNIPNHTNTYLLIRNGENIYRIFTEKISIQDRLFPRRKELHELYEKMQKESWEDNKDKIEDEMYQYKKRAILMQGLIDRTDMFSPLPVEKLNIFKLHEAGEYVNFIYDDEAMLTSGRPSFKEWKKKLNEGIGHGSRILMTGDYSDGSYYRNKDYSDRFYLAKNSYDGLRDTPDLPPRGAYEVEEFIESSTNHYKLSEYKKRIKELTAKGTKFKDEGILKGKAWTRPDEKTGSNSIFVIRTFREEKDLTIMYKPQKEATKGWNDWSGHERKNRARFKIYPDDFFILNYDQLCLDDIQYYLTNRTDRENYLTMMPILKSVKLFLIEEMKNEEFFIKFIVGRNIKALHQLTEKQIEERVRESIVWWKYKNKWKRPITKDDTLALRMIEKRITSDNYETLKKKK